MPAGVDESPLQAQPDRIKECRRLLAIAFRRHDGRQCGDKRRKCRVERERMRRVPHERAVVALALRLAAERLGREAAIAQRQLGHAPEEPGVGPSRLRVGHVIRRAERFVEGGTLARQLADAKGDDASPQSGQVVPVAAAVPERGPQAVGVGHCRNRVAEMVEHRALRRGLRAKGRSEEQRDEREEQDVTSQHEPSPSLRPDRNSIMLRDRSAGAPAGGLNSTGAERFT